ncbi:hypothetical protein JQN58_04670 [Aneurinibacillus sp. BA2021]|nr:hypothetical protein [Aneurinibacillus sp. BA2021]
MKTYTAKQKGLLSLVICGVIGTPVLAASLQEDGQTRNAVAKPATAVAEAEDMHQVTANPILNQPAEEPAQTAQMVERVPLDKTLDQFIAEQERVNRVASAAQPATRSEKMNTATVSAASSSTATQPSASSVKDTGSRIEDTTRKELVETGLTPGQIAKIERLVASGVSLDALIAALDEKGEGKVAKALIHEKEAKEKKQPAAADGKKKDQEKNEDDKKPKNQAKQKHEDNGKHKGHDKNKEKKDKEKDDDDE